MRPSDTRFQHPAAPNRNPGVLANVVHAASFRETANPSQLDINDAAGIQPNRLFSVVGGTNTFV